MNIWTHIFNIFRKLPADFLICINPCLKTITLTSPGQRTIDTSSDTGRCLNKAIFNLSLPDTFK